MTTTFRGNFIKGRIFIIFFPDNDISWYKFLRRLSAITSDITQLQFSCYSSDVGKAFIVKSTTQGADFDLNLSRPASLLLSCPPASSPHPDVPRPHGGVGAAGFHRHHRQRGGHEVHQGGRQQPGHQGPHCHIWRSALPARRYHFHHIP